MRDADDPIEAEVIEAVVDERARTLGREALPQASRQEPVADLDVRRLPGVLEREPADERAGVAARRAPDAEVGVERRIARRCAPAIAQHRDARRGLAVGDVAHHPRIAVEAIRGRRSPRRRTRAGRGAASASHGGGRVIALMPAPWGRLRRPVFVAAARPAEAGPRIRHRFLTRQCREHARPGAPAPAPSSSSSRSPSMIASILYSVRLIRWSVTRPCGKL